LEQVVKRYSSAHGWIEALGGVNLRVPRATIQAIIGFSGAGKSTLLRCISGLEAPDRGRVLVNGIDVAELRGAALREARRNLGVDISTITSTAFAQRVWQRGAAAGTFRLAPRGHCAARA